LEAQKATVGKRGRIEILSPELPIGATVEIIVLIEPPSPNIKKEHGLHSLPNDKQLESTQKEWPPDFFKKQQVVLLMIRLSVRLKVTMFLIDELKIGKVSKSINADPKMAADNSSNHKFREHQQAAIKSISNEIDILGKMVIQGDILPDIESALGRLQGIINRAKASSLVGVEQKTVFHDHIDAHFSELLVSNYKQIIFNTFIKNKFLKGSSKAIASASTSINYENHLGKHFYRSIKVNDMIIKAYLLNQFI